jgi:hypothetical protein
VQEACANTDRNAYGNADSNADSNADAVTLQCFTQWIGRGKAHNTPPEAGRALTSSCNRIKHDLRNLSDHTFA